MRQLFSFFEPKSDRSNLAAREMGHEKCRPEECSKILGLFQSHRVGGYSDRTLHNFEIKTTRFGVTFI